MLTFPNRFLHMGNSFFIHHKTFTWNRAYFRTPKSLSLKLSIHFGSFSIRFLSGPFLHNFILL
ncbi:hypothetical protein Hanom_Chr16g01423591 [Helianthus anomalus]